MSLSLSCIELVWGAFWRVLMNGVACMFAWHEPNQALVGCGGQVHSPPEILHLQIPQHHDVMPQCPFRPLEESMPRRVAAPQSRGGPTWYYSLKNDYSVFRTEMQKKIPADSFEELNTEPAAWSVGDERGPEELIENQPWTIFPVLFSVKGEFHQFFKSCT